MAAEYHYLVAGLIEYNLDGDNTSLNISSIKDEIVRSISKKENKYFALMLGYYDVENIIMSLNGRDNQFSTLANYSKEEVQQIIERLKGEHQEQKDEFEVDEEVVPIKFFDFIERAIKLVNSGKEGVEIDIEKALLTSYYSEMESSKCGFIKEWGEADRAIRNICASIEARRKGRDISDVVIGSGFVVDSLITSNAPDFGLKGEVDFVDKVLAIIDQKDMLKKEKELDLLRWQTIDELTLHNYFDINFILAYYLKLCMINRWLTLDPKIGREMFDKIVAEFSNKRKFNIE